MRAVPNHEAEDGTVPVWTDALGVQFDPEENLGCFGVARHSGAGR